MAVPAATPGTPRPTSASAHGANLEARRFLLDLLNDGTAALGLRVEAAKDLLHWGLPAGAEAPVMSVASVRAAAARHAQRGHAAGEQQGQAAWFWHLITGVFEHTIDRERQFGREHVEWSTAL